MEGCRWCAHRERESVAVAVYTGGCVHEHVAEVPVCAEHLAESQALSARGLFCPACRHAGEYGHFCPVTITGVRRLAGAQ